MSPLTTFAPSPKLTSLGAGQLFFDRFLDTGLPSGAMFSLGNCSNFGIAVKVTTKQVENFLTAAGGIYDQANLDKTQTVKIDGYEYGPDQFAMITMGQLPTAVTQTANPTITAEALASATVTKKGRAFQTAFRSITVTDVKQGATTLVLNVDYVVKDAALGIIYFPETGAVDDTMAVTIDYACAALVATDGVRQINAGMEANIIGKLLFVPEPRRGPSWEVLVPIVTFTPTGDLNFIGTDYGKWTVEGQILDNSANDPTNQWYRLTRRS